MNNIKIKMITITIFALFLTIGCDDSPTGNTTPESATISGTITFTGTWPTNGTITVSLSSNWPPQGAPAASLTITSSDTYSYTFDNVTFGTYGAITVSCLDPGDGDPATNQHILGSYGGTADYIYGPYYNATTITVSDTLYSLTGIDFTADLSLVVITPDGI